MTLVINVETWVKSVLAALLGLVYLASFLVGTIGYVTVLMALRDGDFFSAVAVVPWANLGSSLFLGLALLFVGQTSVQPSWARMKIAASAIALLAVYSILTMEAISPVNLFDSLVAVVVPPALQVFVFIWASGGDPKVLRRQV